MAQSDGRSLQAIRQESEQTRTDLMTTVELLRSSIADTSRDIRERATPAAIKSEVANYARSRGEQWFEDLKTAARENPLQAVAVCGSLAYPLLRVVRTLPVPLLMIGAGLYLARSKGGRAERRYISADELGEGVWDPAASGESSDPLSQAKARVGATAAQVQETVAEKAGAVTEAVKVFADQATSIGQRYAGAAREMTQGAVRSVKESASDIGGRANKSLAETLEQNPLAVAGVGLLIGGLVAAALPRTEMEDGVLGKASRSVKRRAQSAASRGFDAAKDAAEQATRRAYGQAEKEGLGPDGVRDMVGDMGERVKRVAETAVTTAFEPPEENDHSNQQGANSHG
jgi:hypothetical protein